MATALLVLSSSISTVSFANTFEQDFVAAAIERTNHSVTYDGAYIAIDYPNGDVPANIGVCTDVVIRSYRAIGVDLQVLVHEDMKQHFSAYPSKRIWGLHSTDRNIDHRRVPNLQTFFSRHGQSLVVSDNHLDYKAGQLVTWMLPGNLPHIGIVTDKLSPTTGNPLISHNIGSGPVLEDMLFDYPITGHYKFVPDTYSSEGVAGTQAKTNPTADPMTENE
ncbi:DUF1287 domain-containing protein [Shewanella maritima]|uniref:DUF1287 domain-containing protein n=1 Tax=Shewanella maritima TaxID=2520507 RepID=UPI001F5EA302|nr:DUF1287 domain-containing protein [Shewanella maritima]